MQGEPSLIMKVDFIIPGAMKCGTTTLFKILDLHPDISFSHPKEPQFFSNTPDWKTHIDEYHACFKKPGKIYGEGSTNYTKYPLFNLNIWEDIYAYNPDMKFIYLVRNPLHRLISHYVHSVERGYLSESLDQAIISDPRLLNGSRYFSQINPFIRQFGRDNVYIMLFDDLIANPEAATIPIWPFLDIAPLDYRSINLDDIHANKSYSQSKKDHRYDTPPLWLKALRKVNRPLAEKIILKSTDHFDQKPEISMRSKEIVWNLLEADIRALETLLDRDLSAWRTS